MERRVFWVRQDPQIANPENRSNFQHPNLEEWVLHHRISLIQACLILIRAWFTAGQPKADLHRGSFYAWAQTVGGILENAGIHHFLGNQTASYARDTDAQEFGKFLLSIGEHFDRPFLTIELVEVLGDYRLRDYKLHETWPDWMREKSRDEGQHCAFLGNVFSKRVDRRFPPSGVFITRDGSTGGRSRWKVMMPDPRPQQVPSPALESQWADEPRDEDVPPSRRGSMAVNGSGAVTLNIKGKGFVSFPSQHAADAFRSAHPEVIE
jgi:hypothetical protein